MNLRNNKGYVMTDASIAVIILLILVPTIMGIVYSVSASRRATEAKAEAINIATNAVETAKGITIADLDEGAVLNGLVNSFQDDTERNMTISNGKGIIKTDKATYELTMSVIDYADTTNAPATTIRNRVKTVTAKVKYRIKGTDQEISLSTVIK